MDPILENENQTTCDDVRGNKSEKGRHKNKKKQNAAPASETVVGKRHKFLVTKLSTADEKEDQTAAAAPSRAYNNAHTIHFGTRGAESQRPHVRGIFDEKPAEPQVARASSVERDSAGAVKEYETFHGTSSSPRSSIFDIFRLRRKSDSRKHGSLIQNVRAALGKPSTERIPQRSLEVPEIRKNGQKIDDKAVSDKRYYNTVTGAPSRKSSTITRVMDIFRIKPSSETSSASESTKKQKNQKPTRRLSLGTTSPTYHKSSYASLDPLQAKQLFREVRGLPRYDPYLSIVQISLGGRDKTRLLLNFFKYHRCHELMPKSAKVIIFDTQFLVRKTFPTLISNGIRSAPLWDSGRKTLVGMVTVTDFIRILLILFEEKNSMQDLESHTLHTWKKLLRLTYRPLQWISPDQSLHEAINILTQHRIHRLPIIDTFTGDVLYVLSHKRILRFLFVYLNEFPELNFFHSKLIDLKIGTYNNITTITDDTTVKDAFDLLLENKVSALPVVDEYGKVLDIYAKCEVLNLVSEKLYFNLLVTVKEVRQKNKDWQEKLQKCHSSITLYEALEIIVRTESHRLILVDKNETLVGIVSLSDMLLYLNRTIPSENKSTALQELFKPLEENKFVESAKESEPDTQSDENADADDSPSSDDPQPQPTQAAVDEAQEAQVTAARGVVDVAENYSKDIVIGETSES